MESCLFFSITFPWKHISKPVSSGFAQVHSPDHRMALSLVVHTTQPVLALVHSPDGHLCLRPTVNQPLTLHLCCVPPPPRSPRQQRTSWRTVKLTCGRTLSSFQCLRQKTPSERRSSFVPSSDSVCYENVSFPSVKSLVETAHAHSFRELCPHPPPPNQDCPGLSPLFTGFLHCILFHFFFSFSCYFHY